MRRLDRTWIWILDEDSEFRTLLAGFAAQFHFQTFDFSNLEEARSGFLFYRDHVRKYPSTHCVLGVIATSMEPSQKEQVSQWLLEIAEAYPDIKTVHLQETRPQTVAELYKLFELFKRQI